MDGPRIDSGDCRVVDGGTFRIFILLEMFYFPVVNDMLVRYKKEARCTPHA